jgi:hypothetical protein
MEKAGPNGCRQLKTISPAGRLRAPMQAPVLGIPGGPAASGRRAARGGWPQKNVA